MQVSEKLGHIAKFVRLQTVNGAVLLHEDLVEQLRVDFVDKTESAGEQTVVTEESALLRATLDEHRAQLNLGARRNVHLHQFVTSLFKIQRGQLSGAVYPGIGQEASMAGIAAGMADTDIFGGTHRDLGVQIKKGVTLKEIALNFFGKHDGPSKGRDGNSHFGVVDKGTLMVVSPLPDSAPVAVGWALASQQSGDRKSVV